MWLFKHVILETPLKPSMEAYVSEPATGLLLATRMVPLDLATLYSQIIL